MSIDYGKKRPVAPPVYRPPKAPAVLQRMMATGRPSLPSHMSRQPVAPPVYRPQPVPRVLQRKESPAIKPPAVPHNRNLTAPPLNHGLRPQSSLQLWQAPNSMPHRRVEAVSPNGKGVVQRRIWIKSQHDRHQGYDVEEAYGLVSQFFTYQREETSKARIGRRVAAALQSFNRVEQHFDTVNELWDAIMEQLANAERNPVAIPINSKVKLRGSAHPARVTVGPPSPVTIKEMHRIDPEGDGNTARPQGTRAPQYRLSIAKQAGLSYVRCELTLSAWIGTVESVYAAPGKRRWQPPKNGFPGKNYVITAEHSRSAKASEQQHCDDVAYVYQITLDAAEKVLSDVEIGPFESEAEAEFHLKSFDGIFMRCLDQYLSTHFGLHDCARYVGADPDAWLKCFRITCEQTMLRDNYGWHDSEHSDQMGEIGLDNYMDVIATDGPRVQEGRNVRPQDLIKLGTTYEERRRR